MGIGWYYKTLRETAFSENVVFEKEVIFNEFDFETSELDFEAFFVKNNNFFSWWKPNYWGFFLRTTWIQDLCKQNCTISLGSAVNISHTVMTSWCRGQVVNFSITLAWLILMSWVGGSGVGVIRISVPGACRKFAVAEGGFRKKLALSEAVCTQLVRHMGEGGS